VAEPETTPFAAFKMPLSVPMVSPANVGLELWVIFCTVLMV
jgi:hypothetical protein